MDYDTEKKRGTAKTKLSLALSWNMVDSTKVSVLSDNFEVIIAHLKILVRTTL